MKFDLLSKVVVYYFGDFFKQRSKQLVPDRRTDGSSEGPLLCQSWPTFPGMQTHTLLIYNELLEDLTKCGAERKTLVVDRLCSIKQGFLNKKCFSAFASAAVSSDFPAYSLSVA